MTGSATPHLTDHAMIERYVAGTASDEEAAAIEAHFLGCANCQKEVELAAAIKLGLSRTANKSAATRKWIGPSLVLAAAAALTIAVNISQRPRLKLEALGNLDSAPLYSSVAIRDAAPSSGTSSFDEGVAAYNQHRYGEAATAFARARTQNSGSASAIFFLGASLLMNGKSQEAVSAFADVAAIGEGPYLAEADYLRAKALLRLGNASEALRALDQAVKRDTQISPAAKALGDSVRSWLQR
jgi:tetratricopeptide (TPR) repeat protein